ncbi:hypothetical protein PZB75_18770 [Streptomyces sp. AM 4-1-1]|uniref:hypothetical protein n=1 Tax=Streptomyces sp. AM 4-1-1 TaxID=3028710 RepID=UPI0023B9FA59|nr:hypothetical protein [Streptomyces sp. AM 4-1-1]WEH35224.1 hypothetical protein PZB75_18770 [Streptomyces sp. AM 4-1-1]
MNIRTTVAVASGALALSVLAVPNAQALQPSPSDATPTGFAADHGRSLSAPPADGATDTVIRIILPDLAPGSEVLRKVNICRPDGSITRFVVNQSGDNNDSMYRFRVRAGHGKAEDVRKPGTSPISACIFPPARTGIPGDASAGLK